MSARRILVLTAIIIALIGGTVLWSRHGVQIFLSGMGGMIC